MKKLLGSFSIVLPLLALLAPTALAQNSTSKPETEAPDQDVAYIRLSAELASAARAVRDPVLMVSAAILEQIVASDWRIKSIGMLVTHPEGETR